MFSLNAQHSVPFPMFSKATASVSPVSHPVHKGGGGTEAEEEEKSKALPPWSRQVTNTADEHDYASRLPYPFDDAEPGPPQTSI